jgi:hypothetical protein
VNKKIHILCDCAEYPGTAEYVMWEITELYACGFRDQIEFSRHIWAFYACPTSFLCNVDAYFRI